MDNSQQQQPLQQLTTWTATQILISNFHQRFSPIHRPQDNMVSSLLQNFFSLKQYGPYYNYGIQNPSEGQDSLDFDGSNSSFELYFPTVQEFLDYLIDPQRFILCQFNEPREVQNKGTIILVSEEADVEAIQEVLSYRNYPFQRVKMGAQYEEKKYQKFVFPTAPQARKALKLLRKELRVLERMTWIQQPIPGLPPVETLRPQVIIRNIPQQTNFQVLKQKVQEKCGVQVLGWTEPVLVKETYNTIVDLASWKDCERVCYFMHKKPVFFKGEIIKCNLHPMSACRRGEISRHFEVHDDTNFLEYMGNSNGPNYQMYIPCWNDLLALQQQEAEDQMMIEQLLSKKKKREG